MRSSEAGAKRLLEVLEPAFSDRTARSRRERVLARDGRDEATIGATFADLDRAVEVLRARLVELRAEAESLATMDTATDLRVAVDPHADPLAKTRVAPRIVGVDRGDEIVVDDGLPTASAAGDAEPTTEILAEAATRPASKRVRRTVETDHERRAAELLYEDVLWLFSVNDGEGALISLERLLMLGRLDGEAREFVDLNADKLLHLYEGYIGPFTKVPVRGEVHLDSMPRAYLEIPSLDRVWRLVNGERSIAQIMEASSPLTRLETCAGLEQLNRARVIQI